MQLVLFFELTMIHFQGLTSAAVQLMHIFLDKRINVYPIF